MSDKHEVVSSILTCPTSGPALRASDTCCEWCDNRGETWPWACSSVGECLTGSQDVEGSTPSRSTMGTSSNREDAAFARLKSGFDPPCLHH
jgi:hypothetical protein